MKKYVAYYRVSTEKQGKSGLGLAAQKHYVEQYITSVQGDLIAEYTDVQSGTKLDRIGLSEAIQVCNNEGATLVVGKIDRLSRDGFRIMAMLEDLSINYIDATSPHDTQFIKELKFSLAKEERQKISERTKAALAALKAKGKRLGTPSNLTQSARLKGAKVRSELARSKPETKQASEIVNLLSEKGYSLRQIANRLEELGMKTSTGKSFHANSVRRLLNKVS